MDLNQLKRHWEAFGSDDPLWAVLTEPDRRGGRWDLDEFLATGERDVMAVLEQLAAGSVTVQRGRALDFGCGVGRLTQALADRFDRCDGVDIAASMIEQAARINRHGDRVRYHVNDAADLRLFADGTFDLLLSLLVLQHMAPRYANRYLAEFIRVLRPGGVAVFQLPSRMQTVPEPLPAGAFRSSVTLSGDAPRSVALDGEMDLRVRIRNDSPHSWPPGSRVRLGSRWRDSRGRLITENPTRADIGTELLSGGEIALGLSVRAPAVAGRHTLELDLIQETVGWFSRRGSTPLSVVVEVRAEIAAAPAGPATALVPEMEMYTSSPAQVRAVVAAAGGELVTVLNDGGEGGPVESHRYVVRRVAQRTPPLPSPSVGYLGDAIQAVPDRQDLFPPVITRRSGRAGRLELRLRRQLGRALEPVTWVQREYDRTLLHALRETHSAIQEQDAEVRRLREELARLKHAPERSGDEHL